MYNVLKDRSDHISIELKELVENTDKYRRRLDSDRRGVINEFLDSKNENYCIRLLTNDYCNNNPKINNFLNINFYRSYMHSSC